MIKLEDGMSLCGRCVWGTNVGYIMKIERDTYTVRWLDGEITTQLRPDEDDTVLVRQSPAGIWPAFPPLESVDR